MVLQAIARNRFHIVASRLRRWTEVRAEPYEVLSGLNAIRVINMTFDR
jgi:hypothetical protein